MKLDRTFARELSKAANGDGSREARFVFLKPARCAAKELSSTNAPKLFNDVLRRYGRSTVAVCVAVTILERGDRMEQRSRAWAREVLTLWTNRPSSLSSVAICDGLHPTRIEEYAGPLIRLTTEEE